MQLILPFPPSVNGYWRSTKKGVLISERARADLSVKRFGRDLSAITKPSDGITHRTGCASGSVPTEQSEAGFR